jgi:S-adenosylmethionine:tRNA ribosyltransferase-isomerase
LTVIPDIYISDFSYDLPEDRIALYPLSRRDQSKLLIWHNGMISGSDFSAIDEAIPGKSLLVFNNTRVIHARLFFRRETGARIEIFCLEPHKPSEYQLAFQQTETAEWKCLVGNAKRWKQGVLEQEIMLQEKKIILKAEMLSKTGNAYIIRFSWNCSISFATVLEASGKMPIPPYLNRDAEESDDERYQTLYAKIDGSVAAPTAGLHFTEEVLKKLTKKAVKSAELTLHVGAGTFQPVKSEQVAEHEMHTETIVVDRELLNNLLHCDGNIIAVGTTSVRSLESLYWLGVKISLNAAALSLHIDQWDPYQVGQDLPLKTALQNILAWMEAQCVTQISFTTAIIIVPGYKFRVVRGMITNFHQPQSTLLLLVGAFLGNQWREVYDYALRNDFRFLSYGDSNIYLKS